jgi:hypothetical protein
MVEKSISILRDLRALNLREYEMWFLEIQVIVRMCASLEPERLDEVYTYSVVTNSFVISWCPVNTNALAPTIESVQMPRPLQ